MPRKSEHGLIDAAVDTDRDRPARSPASGFFAIADNPAIAIARSFGTDRGHFAGNQ
jgi:hypothetical protein